MNTLFEAQVKKNDIQFKEKTKTINGKNGFACENSRPSSLPARVAFRKKLVNSITFTSVTLED